MRYGCYLNIISNFAASEGRNPWVKNAFLAFIPQSEIANFNQQRDENNATLILFAYMHTCTAHAVLISHICYSVGYLFLCSFLLWCLAIPTL